MVCPPERQPRPIEATRQSPDDAPGHQPARLQRLRYRAPLRLRSRLAAAQASWTPANLRSAAYCTCWTASTAACPIPKERLVGRAVAEMWREPVAPGSVRIRLSLTCSRYFSRSGLGAPPEGPGSSTEGDPCATGTAVRGRRA
jgi:hypothetical protein